MLSTKRETERQLDPRVRAAEMRARFREKFGGEPELWARAPGRVDLMGSHTDYNLGFVLTLPISRDTWIAARATGGTSVRVHSMNFDADDRFDLPVAGRSTDAKWGNYVCGVAATFAQAGYAAGGCDLLIQSSVPVESGLSSSAALECALATALAGLFGWNLSPEGKALLCQKAEHDFAGVRCGILDQYSSCLGRRGCALLLDCRDLSTRAVRIADGVQVVICNTMARRRLSGGEYAQRRAECEQGAAVLGVSSLRELTSDALEARCHELPDQVAKRCRFIVEESARAAELSQALEAGDRTAVSRLCGDSFAGARDLYEICSDSMLAMLEAMLNAPGVIGARQAGAGFGGCMVAMVETNSVDAFSQGVREAYACSTGIVPEVYAVHAAEGAQLIDSDILP
jgi:galactokinase